MNTSFRRAFTLIELLVVIAVIGVLVGALGMALSSGDRGPALQAAQANLNSMVAAARAQAALDNATCTILVWADETDMETYLRRACIAREVDTDNNGTLDAWARQGQVTDLPRGIFFAPGNLGGSFPAKWETAADWSNLVLTESQEASNAPTTSLDFKILDETVSNGSWLTDPLGTTKAYKTLAFDPVGNLVSMQGGVTISTLAVATGELEPGSGVIFKSADSLRGLKLSIYGVPIVLNEKTAFKP
jgi:prepilin-type N-terminal cleavage/methylation domain-containing protein